MSPNTSIFLRACVGALGFLLICTLFLYENEQGLIQSKLEDWWIRIDDIKAQALSRHVAFMKVLAGVLANLLDRIFGPKTISIQAIGVSICYSLIWIGVGLMIMKRLNAKSISSDEVPQILFGIGFGTLTAIFPTRIRRSTRRTLILIWFSLLCFILFVQFLYPMLLLAMFAFSQDKQEAVSIPVTAIVAVVLTICLFGSFVAVMRASVRAISNSRSAVKIIALSLINALPLLTFYGLFRLVLFTVEYSEGKYTELISIIVLFAVLCAVLFNSVFALSAVAFICLALLMLLYRIFWPVLSRPIYKLQALGIARRNNVLAVLGVVLITASWRGYEFLHLLVDTLKASISRL
jgi:hypothetical protein